MCSKTLWTQMVTEITKIVTKFVSKGHLGRPFLSPISSLSDGSV